MSPSDQPGDDLALDARRTIPAAALQERFTTSGGPGGQNVNKFATRVELRLDLATCGLDESDLERIRERLANRISGEDVLVLHASEERSREDNRVAARERLRALLRAALQRRKRRRPTRPTRASKERRLEAKRQRGERKAERSRRPREGQ